jgi:hypothetical protein
MTGHIVSRLAKRREIETREPKGSEPTKGATARSVLPTTLQ